MQIIQIGASKEREHSRRRCKSWVEDIVADAITIPVMATEGQAIVVAIAVSLDASRLDGGPAGV